MRTLLIISQVYPPDPAAVGQHVADVAAEAVRRGWRVIVYTSARGYEDPTVRFPVREVIDGVHVRRLPLSSFGKRSITHRLVGQAVFMLQAIVRGLFVKDLAHLLTSTSPPFAGFGGAVVSWIRGIPMTWWVMDVNPDQLIATGRIRPGSLPARVFDRMNRATLRQATSIIVLDQFMKERVIAKRDVTDKMTVIPPWPHTPEPARLPIRGNRFRDEHGLRDKFVVMYSGNHAIQHPLTTLLQAAERLEADDRIVFVFIGGGAGKAEVQSRVENGAKNIRIFGYQPRERLEESLAAADLHVVTMGNDTVGIVHPSKLYGAMAVGRPILYFGPSESPIGEVMSRHQVGWSVGHGDVEKAVSAIQESLAIGEQERERIGACAAAVVGNSLSAISLRARVCDVIDS